MIPVGGHLFRTQKESAAGAVFTIGNVGQHVMVSSLAPVMPIPIYFEKMGAFWPITRFVIIALAILTIASSVLFAFIWIPRKLLGRMKDAEHLSVRALPLLGALAFVFFVSFLEILAPAPYELAKPDLKSTTIYLAPIAFAILSVLAAGLAIRSCGFQMNRAVRIHSLLVAFACLGVAWYLAYWGQIGLRPWAPW
jgi:hypothetical protein